MFHEEVAFRNVIRVFDGRESASVRRAFAYAAVALYILVFSPPQKLDRVSANTRNAYMSQGKIRQQVDIPRMDILIGPKNEIAVPPESDLACNYVEPQGPVLGFTPKFQCAVVGSGKVVRVKYHRRETFGEVAGTRLLWALGFYTDETYPVKLRCLDCPAKNAFKPEPGEPRKLVVLDDAIVERNFQGKEIAEQHDQGWKWSELDLVDSRMGGATKAEIDALKLLAVFMQHTDSKPSQQRLACYSQDIEKKEQMEICKKPVLMIQDLGETFGVGSKVVTSSSAMYYKGWSEVNVWNHYKEAESRKNGKTECFGLLTASEGRGLTDPEISEEGRRLLSGLLNQLTDQQIRDLFVVSRADKTGELIYRDGIDRPVSIDDWVAAFKHKREQINQHQCN